MRLVRFVTPISAATVSAHLWGALRMLALIFIPPTVAAIATGELLYVAILIGIGSATYVAGRLGAPAEIPELSLPEAFVVAAMMYILFSLVGALVYLPQATFIDALFEAVSGFTTTGLSVLRVEELPRSLLFFRSYTQWVGGAGISVLSLVVLSGPGQAAFRLYASEYGRENLLGSVLATARVVTTVYAVLTAAGWLIFIVSGMAPFEDLLHILTTVSTGGFSAHPDSIGHYGSAAIRISVLLFMLFGATSLPLFYRLRGGGFGQLFGDLQLRALLALTLLAMVVSLVNVGRDPNALLAGTFNSTAALTTTGFHVSPPRHWPDGLQMLSVILMFVGGSLGSTAGGIKLFRLIILLKLGGWTVIRMLLPQEARTAFKYGGIVVSDSELRQIFAFFSLYLGLAVFSSFLLTLGGFSSSEAVFESLSALGTVGLSTGLTAPELAPWPKLLLCFDMLAGRLEILPLILLIFPYTWSRPRRSA